MTNKIDENIKWLFDSKIEPIEKNLDSVWSTIDRIRIHKCVNEERIKNTEETLKKLPNLISEINSWKNFRKFLIGAVTTLLFAIVAAIISFTTLKADTEYSKNTIGEQKQQLISLEKDVQKIRINSEKQEERNATIRILLTKVDEIKKKIEEE
jgi:hypothetical protein